MRKFIVAIALVIVLPASGCATSLAGADGGVIDVAASIDPWGSILAQLGGSHVRASSIISNPDVDPHDYEPTPQNAVTIARSRLFVENGIGYDTWAAKTLAASPDSGRRVIDVGDLVGAADGGNPHRWYSPADVTRVADTITADLTRLEPSETAYFAARHKAFVTAGLRTYHRLVNAIRTSHAGTPIGASESIVTPLAHALGLDLITPPSFLRAVSEGADPAASDLATIDRQIRDRRIRVYVYNSQNATPDVAAQVRAAKAAGIPVCPITETVTPAGASFEHWQTDQLRALSAALHRAGAP